MLITFLVGDELAPLVIEKYEEVAGNPGPGFDYTDILAQAVADMLFVCPSKTLGRWYLVVQRNIFSYNIYKKYWADFLFRNFFYCLGNKCIMLYLTFFSGNQMKSISGPASWLSCNAFISGAGGPSFKSRVGLIEQSVANGSPPLRHFFERSSITHRRTDGPRKLVTRFDVIQRV